MLPRKLNQKILLFWLSSIVISMLLLGVVFYLLQNNLYEQTNKQQISDAFERLQKHMQDTEQHLHQNALFVTEQQNIVSSFSLLHQYQDIENYQPIIFDQEKKKLNQDLVKLLKSTSSTVVTAHDGHNRLNSFVYTDSSNNIFTGYQSYENDKAVILGAKEGSAEFKTITALPEYVQHSLYDVPGPGTHSYLDIHGNHTVLEMNVPVIRSFPNGEKLMVGRVSVINELDGDYVENLSSLTGLGVLLSADELSWISSFNNSNIIPELNAFSGWENISTGLNNWYLVTGKVGSFGVARYKTPESTMNIKFALVPQLDGRLATFPLLQNSLLVVLLANLLLLLPVGIFFLRKNILLPVAQLVNGVESLKKGHYENLKPASGSGELAFLADSFNEMAESIQARENELIKLSLAVEQSPISMIITDTHSKIEYVNEAFCTISGYSKNEIIGKEATILKGGGTPEESYEDLWSTITKGEKWRGVFHNKTKNGNLIWESVTILPIKSAEGEIINYLCLNEDITQIRKTREQLALQSAALQAADDGIVITDVGGTIQWVNPAYEALTGYSLHEAIGKNPRILNSGRQGAEFFKGLWDTILSGKSWKGELYNKRKDGEIYLEEQSITPVHDKDNNIINFVAIKRDITQQRKQEKELHQSQKMDALGKLTGGVAHDYNNMLGIIMGYSDLLMFKVADDPVLMEYASAIKTAGERGANLTKKLLTFSRQQSGDLSLVNINSLLSDNQLMLEKTLTARIKLVLRLEDGLCDVFMDGNDFDDAVLNMSINAMHAMAGSGHLTISTANVFLDDSQAKTRRLASGDYVLLSIKDTGTGMDQVTQQQIFEPFFSTKGDKGTGLGLSQVYGFVKSTKGFISIDSELGRGTQFNIYFPCHIESNKESSASPDDKKQDLIGSETILVVDDEASLARLTKEILRRNGYTALSADSAQQALEVLKKQSVDLVLTDVIMPDMDGYELALEVTKLYPDTKIQHISGYNDIDNADLEKHGFPESLHKPLEPKIMLIRIRELFGESST